MVPCPFDEDKEGIGIASDTVKVQGEYPTTPASRGEDRARRYVGDSQSWVRAPWLDRKGPLGP